MRGLGVLRGWELPDGRHEYRPLEPTTREAMAVFLFRHRFLLGFGYVPPTHSPFIDVPTDATFYREISWLASEGISTGWDIGEGKREFRPGEHSRPTKTSERV